MKLDKRSMGLHLAFITCVAAGLATLMPFSGASESSILGYRAYCTFTPISTVLLFYAGLLALGKIRKKPS